MVDRLLPFQFEVVHAPGKAEYLCRHIIEKIIETNKKIKTKELWNSWFTVSETVRIDKFVSANQKSQAKQNHPIGAMLASENTLASENERQNSAVTSSYSEVMKTNKQPLKQRASNSRQIN